MKPSIKAISLTAGLTLAICGSTALAAVPSPTGKTAKPKVEEALRALNLSNLKGVKIYRFTNKNGTRGMLIKTHNGKLYGYERQPAANLIDHAKVARLISHNTPMRIPPRTLPYHYYEENFTAT